MSQWINKVNFDTIVLHRKTQERAGKCLGEHYHFFYREARPSTNLMNRMTLNSNPKKLNDSKFKRKKIE